MIIGLRELRIEGFRSFTKRTLIQFKPEPGFKLLCGDNQVMPRLGSNGAGKSSTWDALVWCLYGLSVRGLKASELVSWGVKRPRVEAILELDGEAISIVRMGNPNALTVNEVAAQQSDIETLIGLNRARFLHSVMFGQGVPLFLDLSMAERGALFDEILDLEIWTLAAQQASLRSAEQAKAAAGLERDEAAQIGRAEAYETASAESAKQAGDWEAKREADLEALLNEAEELNGFLEEMDEKMAAEFAETALQPKLIPQSTPAKALQQERDALMAERAEVQLRHKQAIEMDAFYGTHEECPTCHQDISADFASDRLKEAKAAILETAARDKEIHKRRVQIEAQMDAAQGLHDAAVQAAVAYNDKLSKRRQQYADLRRRADRAMEQAEALAEQDNPALQGKKRYRKLAMAAREAAEELQTKRHAAMAEQKRAEFWRDAFRRLRLRIIDEALALFELEATNAAQGLGLMGWRIRCVTETETKSGGARLGLNIKAESPDIQGPWSAWSGGESQRVRLAVSLGLSSMIQKRAGRSFDFEVWDEPSAWLSAEGIEDLLEALRARSMSLQRSVWLLDHRALMQAGFDEVWTARKTAEGTTLVPGI